MKAFLILQETETPKKFLMFQETGLSYFQKTSYISRSNFPSSKKCLISREMELPRPFPEHSQLDHTS